MTNSTLDAIFERRSVRSYTDERLSDEAVATLANAALAAPSGMNAQPWHIVAVQNNELILELERATIDYFVKVGNTALVERCKSRGNKIFYNASTAFVIAMKAGSSPIDVGIVSENICIAASSMGLGSIILGLPRAPFEDSDTSDYWVKKLGFPEGYVFGIAVAVGFAADDGKPHPVDTTKLSYVK